MIAKQQTNNPLDRQQPETRSILLSRRAVTLVEIMIVVVILGILAAIVLPQFSDASQESHQSSLKETLRTLRTKVSLFKAQHQGVPPGYANGELRATPDSDTFDLQMTSFSDSLGATSSAPSARFKLGPYLSQVPANPISGKRGVWVVTDTALPPPDESQNYGWIYNARTLDIAPNLQGADSSGTLYRDY